MRSWWPNTTICSLPKINDRLISILLECFSRRWHVLDSYDFYIFDGGAVPMMRTRALHLLFLVIVALGGCVYKAPISFTASREIDRSLIGTWQPFEEPDSKLIIAEADPTHYNIGVRPPKGNPLNVPPTDFRAHHTKVGEIDIVNLQIIDPEKNNIPHIGVWAFVSYTLLDQDKLKLRMVNDRVILTPMDPRGKLLTTPEAMKLHFESVINRPDLFAPKEMVFRRLP